MRRPKITSYNPKLKILARELRNRSTLAEVLLWNQLRNKRMLGYDFHRQKPIDEFIVDFFCPDLMLAIEIDGNSHGQKGREDLSRQHRLESIGVHFIRFEDRMVKRQIQNVLGSIEGWIWEHAKKRRSPVQRRADPPERH
jgi:very-short-patch-repair endonuclease